MVQDVGRSLIGLGGDYLYKLVTTGKNGLYEKKEGGTDETLEC